MGSSYFQNQIRECLRAAVACSGHVAGDGNDMIMKLHCYPGNIAMLCIAFNPSQPTASGTAGLNNIYHVNSLLTYKIYSELEWVYFSIALRHWSAEKC